MRTYRVKYETMTGYIKTAWVKAGCAGEAVDQLCEEYSVANLLGVWDSKGRQLI